MCRDVMKGKWKPCGSVWLPAFCPLNFSDNSVTLVFAFPLPSYQISSSTPRVKQAQTTSEISQYDSNTCRNQQVFDYRSYFQLFVTKTDESQRQRDNMMTTPDVEVRIEQVHRETIVSTAFTHNEVDHTFYDVQ